MRLTLVVLRMLRYGRVPGSKLTGKVQVPHFIKQKDRKKFVKDLKAECFNEMWLTRSYLDTTSERFLNNKIIKKFPGTPTIQHSKHNHEFKNKRFRINMKQDVRFEDIWGRLRTTEQWKRWGLERPRPKFEKEARAVIPERYPERLPRPQERWDAWNKVEGFGKKRNN